MRLLSLLALLLSLTACNSSRKESTGVIAVPKQIALLPFPEATGLVYPLTLEEVQSEVRRLDQVAGSYPPRCRDELERQAAYRDWSAVVLAAESLHATAEPSEGLFAARAALYRQGHNLDVRECARRADEAIQQGLSAYPDSVDLNRQAAYFYLQINPKYAPEGEKALLRLRQLLGTDQDPEVESGLVYAYLYQKRLDEARRQIEHALKLNPGNRALLAYREALAQGTPPKVLHIQPTD